MILPELIKFVTACSGAAELLLAMTRVATPASEGDIAQARRMVGLLIDGLSNVANAPAKSG